jgi:hypothetical protein
MGRTGVSATYRSKSVPESIYFLSISMIIKTQHGLTTTFIVTEGNSAIHFITSLFWSTDRVESKAISFLRTRSTGLRPDTLGGATSVTTLINILRTGCFIRKSESPYKIKPFLFTKINANIAATDVNCVKIYLVKRSLLWPKHVVLKVHKKNFLVAWVTDIFVYLI